MLLTDGRGICCSPRVFPTNSLYHLIYRSDLDFSPRPDLPLTPRNRAVWGKHESHPTKVFKRKQLNSSTPEFT